MPKGIKKRPEWDESAMVLNALADNYAVRRKVFDKGLPKLKHATKIAARIRNRNSDVETALVSLLMALYQTRFIPETPDGYYPYNDYELEATFF